MHLEKIWLTTNGKSKSKVRSTRKLVEAKQKHDAYLRKQGIHPDQLAAKRSSPVKDVATPGYVYEPRRPKTSDTVGNGFRTGMLDKLHLEPENVRAEIVKKSMRVEMLYPKGPCQFVTDGTDTTMLGNRARRG
jgi:hypothetical protein